MKSMYGPWISLQTSQNLRITALGFFICFPHGKKNYKKFFSLLCNECKSKTSESVMQITTQGSWTWIKKIINSVYFYLYILAPL